MNPALLHRISEIEKEMDSELDLRAVATQPLSEAPPEGRSDLAAHWVGQQNWADPARYDFAPLGVESALPPSFTAPPAKPALTTDDFFTWAEDMWRAGLTVAKWIAAIGLLIFVLGLSAGYFHR